MQKKWVYLAFTFFMMVSNQSFVSAQEIEDSANSHSASQKLGWICKSVSEDGPKILTNTWFEFSHSGGDGTYKMRVEGVKGRAIYQLAFLDHAYFNTRSSLLVINGQDSNAQIELRIDQQDKGTLDSPGLLKVSEQTHLEVNRTRIEAAVEMVCNRSRFSDNQ